MTKKLPLSLAFCALAACAAPAQHTSSASSISSGSSGPDGKPGALARQVLTELVAADTTNPPGHEARAVEIGAKRLREAGIPYEVIEYEPGSTDLVARLKGDGSAKPFLILAHTDVVGVTDQKWTSPPHELVERDGYLVGRGSSDDLGPAAVSLETFIRIRQSGLPLKRDVILAWTGGEESSGPGIRYLLKHRPELISDAEFAINEGGHVVFEDGPRGRQVRFASVQIGEKTYQDFTITAKGVGGHSSVPGPGIGNAIGRLGRALDRIARHEQPARLIPGTRAYFKARASLEVPKLARAMTAIAASAPGKPLPKDALAALQSRANLRAMFRTTCVPTLVSGGTRVNSLPAEARANVNCRILPDQTPDQVRAELTQVIGDSGVEVAFKEVDRPSKVLEPSGALYEAIGATVDEMWPGKKLVPTITSSASDSRFLREIGVRSYGLSPIWNDEESSKRIHGADERIPTDSLEVGVKLLEKITRRLATGSNSAAK